MTDENSWDLSAMLRAVQAARSDVEDARRAKLSPSKAVTEYPSGRRRTTTVLGGAGALRGGPDPARQPPALPVAGRDGGVLRDFRHQAPAVIDRAGQT